MSQVSGVFTTISVLIFMDEDNINPAMFILAVQHLGAGAKYLGFSGSRLRHFGFPPGGSEIHIHSCLLPTFDATVNELYIEAQW